jgi:hypothetical protein
MLRRLSPRRAQLTTGRQRRCPAGRRSQAQVACERAPTSSGRCIAERQRVAGCLFDFDAINVRLTYRHDVGDSRKGGTNAALRAAAEAAAKAKQLEVERKAAAEAQKIVAIWNARRLIPSLSCRRCSPNAPFAKLEMLTAEWP